MPRHGGLTRVCFDHSCTGSHGNIISFHSLFVHDLLSATDSRLVDLSSRRRQPRGLQVGVMTGEQPLASSSRVTLDGSPRDDMPYTAETITTTDAEGGLDDNDAIITAAPTTDHKGKAKAVSGQDEAQSLDELEDEEEYSDTEDEEGDEACKCLRFHRNSVADENR